MIPKGTPAGTIANISYVAIEDVKVLGKMATGELTMKEGIEKLEQTTVSTAAGLVAMGKGAAIGAAIWVLCLVQQVQQFVGLSVVLLAIWLDPK